MKIRTHTFYGNPEKWAHVKSASCKLSRRTLQKRGASYAQYLDIDLENPSKGYFNHRDAIG